MVLLEVNNLRTSFHTRHGIVRAVNDVSFSLEKGETLGIVGESGSGKSVTCYSLMRLIPQPPGRIEGGSAMFDGVDLLSASPEQLRSIRGKRISMIFQDPMTSLNPYMRISEQLIEPLLIHENVSLARLAQTRHRRIGRSGRAGCGQSCPQLPARVFRRHEAARDDCDGLITKPELLIADEPTTALDVTVQAQILDLVKKMQRELGMAVIWITHDLGVVAGFCQRVQVMYAGRIVERAPTEELFRQTAHPYTQALQKSIPALQPKGAALYTIRGMPPDLSLPTSGCPFEPRCEFAQEQCRQPWN